MPRVLQQWEGQFQNVCYKTNVQKKCAKDGEKCHVWCLTTLHMGSNDMKNSENTWKPQKTGRKWKKKENAFLACDGLTGWVIS